MNQKEMVMWILIAVLAASAFGIINLRSYLPGQTTPTTFTCPYDGLTFPTQAALNQHMSSAHPGQPTTPTGTTHDAASIQFQVSDAILSASVVAANTYIDICQATAGTFDFLTQADTLTVATTPDTMNIMFADGSQIIMHVASTADPAAGGTDYYDGWYYCTLHAGSPVYYLTPSMLQQVSGVPHYTYTVSTAGAATTGFAVTWTSGTTNYWDIGKLYIWPRTTAANLDSYISYSGITQSSMTDGTTFITGSSTANSTLAGATEHFSYLFVENAANLAYGVAQPVITTQGQMQEYQPVMIMSTNMTSIDVSQLQSEGWIAINDNTLTSEKAFYKPLSAWYITKGSTWTQPIQIPVYDAAAAAGRYIFRFWVLDNQLLSNVAIGSSSSTIPTAYGFISYYGLSAFIYARPYTVSSGAGSAAAMTCWLVKS